MKIIPIRNKFSVGYLENKTGAGVASTAWREMPVCFYLRQAATSCISLKHEEYRQENANKGNFNEIFIHSFTFAFKYGKF